MQSSLQSSHPNISSCSENQSSIEFLIQSFQYDIEILKEISGSRFHLSLEIRLMVYCTFLHQFLQKVKALYCIGDVC